MPRVVCFVDVSTDVSWGKAKRSDDYHKEMSTEVFLHWLKTNVLPNIDCGKRTCVLVLAKSYISHAVDTRNEARAELLHAKSAHRRREALGKASS